MGRWASSHTKDVTAQESLQAVILSPRLQFYGRMVQTHKRPGVRMGTIYIYIYIHTHTHIYIYIYHIYASSHAVSTHRRLSQEAELIPHSPANTLIDQNTSSHAHKTHYTCRFRTSRYTSLQRCENSRYTWDTEEQQYELRWVQVRKGRKEEGGLGRTSQHKNNTTSKES